MFIEWGRSNWHRMKRETADFLTNRAGTERGFLRLINFLRACVLLFLTLRFGLVQGGQSDQGSLLVVIKLALWVYFYFIISQIFLTFFRPDWFDSPKNKLIQLIIDSITITFFYAVTGDPRSDIFLFYFLPILIIARYFNNKTINIFLVLTILSTALIWSQNMISVNAHSIDYWLSVLISRPGFLFVLVLFYLIYQRRRQMVGHLKRAEEELLFEHRHLSVGVFTVDSDLTISSVNLVMSQRHGAGLIGKSCHNAFCGTSHNAEDPCSQCPLPKALKKGGGSTEGEMRLADREGNTYMAHMSVAPILGKDRNPVGATAVVTDMSRYRYFEENLMAFAADVERTIEFQAQENREQTLERTRQLEAISRASKAVLEPDQKLNVEEIVRAIASLLRSQIINVRSIGNKSESVHCQELILTYSYGYSLDDISKYRYLSLETTSIATGVFKTGLAHQEDDILTKPHLFQFHDKYKEYGMHTMACFPLIAKGEVLGTISVYRNRREKFSTDELSFGQTLANNLAATIHNHALLEENTKISKLRQRSLDAIRTLSSQLVPHEDIESLVKLVAAVTREKLHAEVAAVFFLNDETLYRQAVSGVDEDWFTDEFYVAGHGITGEVVQVEPGKRYGQPQIENAVDTSTKVIQEHLIQYQKNLPSGTVRHLLAVPLNGQDGTFGVLRVVNKLDEQNRLHEVGFDQRDLDLMTMIACITAVAMENTRRLAEQNFLMELGRTVTSSLSTYEILEESLLRAVSFLEAEAGAVILPDSVSGDMVFRFIGGNGAEQLYGQKIPAGLGITGKVFSEKQSLLVNDVNQDERFYANVEAQMKFKTRSLISAPIVVRNEAIGVLELLNKCQGSFTVNDLHLLNTMSNWIASAIDNAQLFTKIEERAEQMFTLNKSLVSFTSTKSRNKVMTRIAQCAIDLLNCDFSIVPLFDHQNKEVAVLPDHGFQGINALAAQNLKFAISAPEGSIFESREVHSESDIASLPNPIFGSFFRDSIGARGIIGAPLFAGEREVGVLYAGMWQPRDFTEEEETLFSILSNQAAMALRNTELFHETKRRADLLELFHQISIAVEQTSDIDRILNIVLTGVTAEYGLRFNRSILLLADSTRQYLEGHTGIGQMTKTEARSIWENLDEQSFKKHVSRVLTNGVAEWTSVHDIAKNLRIPIRSDSQEVFSRAYVTGEIMIVDPTTGERPIDSEFYRLFQPGVFVLVPLSIEGNTIGVLVVDNKFTNVPITETELEVLKTCASQTAAAVSRSRLHEDVKGQVEVLNKLQQTVQHISQLIDLRDSLRRIARMAKDVLDADITYLTPFEPNTDELLVELAASDGLEEQFLHHRRYSHSGLTQLVMEEPSGIMLIEDIKQYPKLNSRFVKNAGIRSVAIVRLEFREEVVGVLYVNYQRQHLFTSMDKTILKVFGNHAAIAIHNARLMQRMEELATLKERDRLREDIHSALNTFQFQVMLPLEDMQEQVAASGKIEMAEKLRRLWLFSKHTDQIFKRIMQDMRDPILSERGLVAALESLKNMMEDTHNIRIAVEIREENRLSADIEHALYRVSQEALSNIVKHTNLDKTNQGQVLLTLSMDPDNVELVIKDEGDGFDPGQLVQNKSGIGLKAMNDWVNRVGGTFHIESNPHSGTKILVVIKSKKGTGDE